MVRFSVSAAARTRGGASVWANAVPTKSEIIRPVSTALDVHGRVLTLLPFEILPDFTLTD
jgi:hypothetical protein